MSSPNLLGLLISFDVQYIRKYVIFILIECKIFFLENQWQVRLQFVSNAKGRRERVEREREREMGGGREKEPEFETEM